MNLKDILNNTEISLVKQEDKKLALQILNIRNEEQVRINMIHQDIIDKETHLKWFDEILKNKKKYFFKIIYDSEIKGAVIFDKNKNSWAFYVSKDSIKGLGAIVEFIFLKKIFIMCNLQKIYCEVFDYNKNVIKLHKKFGFVPISYKILFSNFLKKKAKLVKLQLNKKKWIEIEKKFNSKFT